MGKYPMLFQNRLRQYKFDFLNKLSIHLFHRCSYKNLTTNIKFLHSKMKRSRLKLKINLKKFKSMTENYVNEYILF